MWSISMSYLKTYLLFINSLNTSWGFLVSGMMYKPKICHFKCGLGIHPDPVMSTQWFFWMSFQGVVLTYKAEISLNFVSIFTAIAYLLLTYSGARWRSRGERHESTCAAALDNRSERAARARARRPQPEPEWIKRRWTPDGARLHSGHRREPSRALCARARAHRRECARQLGWRRVVARLAEGAGVWVLVWFKYDVLIYCM